MQRAALERELADAERAAAVDGRSQLGDRRPLQRAGDRGPDGRGGLVAVLHQRPDRRMQLRVAVLGQGGQRALVAALLRPLIQVGEGRA